MILLWSLFEHWKLLFRLNVREENILNPLRNDLLSILHLLNIHNIESMLVSFV